MSGAGKSTALRFLEDAGYFCVDNLPVSLILPFARISSDGKAPDYTKIALGIDIRSGKRLGEIGRVLHEMSDEGIRYDVLYLDASDDVLLKRYKESRRVHPLSGPEGDVGESIRMERSLMSHLRERADYIIDTSQLLTRELRGELVKIFVDEHAYKNLYVTIKSFGFKYGIPADSDLVFDVRFLPNPYYDMSLRGMTGLDAPVREFIHKSPESSKFLDKLEDMLTFLIPNYVSEGKNQLVVSIGCTGGRHRSCALADEIYQRLKKHTEYGVRIEHRDMTKDLVKKESDYGVK